jgi:hypothetical protein
MAGRFVGAAKRRQTVEAPRFRFFRVIRGSAFLRDFVISWPAFDGTL